ncbi:MAG: Zn-ribbon domain-containing OB-fold protein [Bacteroidota bacterium]
MPSPRYTRENPQRLHLEAAKCTKCGKISFPPRLICPNCKGKEFQKVQLADEGKILTYTVVRVASRAFSMETPYVVGIVELNGGVRLTTQIVDCAPEDVTIGKPVKLVFRRIQQEGNSGILEYGYKCRLL